MMRPPTPMQPGIAMCNALTIDVEDYFQVSAMAPYIARSEWDTREGRVEQNVDRILAMLDEYGARATFFTLGWVAERYPQLMRRIVDAGYGIQRADAFDMFPNTPHVETVVVFEQPQSSRTETQRHRGAERSLSKIL